MIDKRVDEPQGGSAQGAPDSAESLEATENLSIEGLQEELAQIQAQCADYLDKYLRSAAAFDNYRKRQARDQERQSQQITADVVRELLPVADDLRRAIEHLPSAGVDDSWVQGVVLIEQKLEKLLHSYGVVEIEAKGVPFDPYYHESLATEVSDEYPEGTVIEVL